jgi:hypothetical protein
MSAPIAADEDVHACGVRGPAGIMGGMTGRQLSEAELFQQSIDAYRTRLYLAVKDSGAFTGARIDHDRKALIFYGVGEPSPEVAAIMAEAPDFVHVQWQAAPNTRDELMAETKRLMLASNTLNAGGPRTDGTALEFTTTDPQLLATQDPQEALGCRYPVTISHGQRPTPA